MVKNILRSAIAAAFLAGAVVANADPFAGTNPNVGQLQWNWYTIGSESVYTNKYDGGAGQFKGTFDPTGNTDTNDLFNFFCYEIGETATESKVPYTRYAGLNNVDGVDSSTNTTQLSRLFANYFGTGPFPTWLPSAANSQQSAALQLAIWEIKYDNDLNLTTGSFHVDSWWATNNVVTLAQGYLTNLGALPIDGWQLYTFNRQGNQNYLTARYAAPDICTDGNCNVPEPGSLALLGLGIVGLGFTRKVKLV